MCNANPFQIKTPESLPPEEAVSLFVDVFTDYQKIKAQGHTFVMGPRGIGKSMIFRYLEPDCQCIKSIDNRVKVNELEFLGLYIPLRNAGFTKITELSRLERNAAHIINEHIMVSFFMQKVFSNLSKENLYKDDLEWDKSAVHYYNEVFLPRINTRKNELGEQPRIYDVFATMAKQMEDFYLQAIEYTKRLSFSNEVIPYNGPLFEYLDFVIPLMVHLSDIVCFPQKTIFFLIDDAHCLSSIQTQILNFWVSTRTSGKVSLKISSQYNYKHFYTVTGATIDTPHDYSEIDMTFVYTGRAKPKYKERITKIIEKRLSNCNINKSANEFFPPDFDQEQKIKEIEESYIKRYNEGNGRGSKRGDDALRYARPDFIKSLSGTSKSSGTYSYSGFDQLVHLSSGIVRYFLEPAYKMYAESMSQAENHEVNVIPPAIQSQVIREEANNFLFHDLPRYGIAGDDDIADLLVGEEVYPREEIDKLSNLIQSLGGLFRQVLLSERSERRVFSIAISDTPSKEVEKVLALGIQLGYLHSSTIGRKDGRSGGRTKLYILNRRLSPIWNLDPTAFAGYLFVQNHLLEEAMKEPFSLLRRLSKNKLQEQEYQLSLFNYDEEREFTVESGE